MKIYVSTRNRNRRNSRGIEADTSSFSDLTERQLLEEYKQRDDDIAQTVNRQLGYTVVSDSSELDIVLEHLGSNRRSGVNVYTYMTIKDAIKLYFTSLHKFDNSKFYHADCPYTQEQFNEYLPGFSLSDTIRVQLFNYWLPYIMNGDWTIQESLTKRHSMMYTHTESYFFHPRENKDALHDAQFNFASFAIAINGEYNRSRKAKADGIDWMQLVQTLQEEYDDGINSIDEQTECGNVLSSICIKLEESLHTYGEAEIQAGYGDYVLLDSETGDELYSLDYEDYCMTVIQIALNSKTLRTFNMRMKKQYLAWIS